ncbi:MAG: aminotransferase class V-fold PLP-dependent enzyme, partial [Ginsengibacter sp.]
LESELLKTGNVYINGNIEFRLPNLSNLSFKNTESEALMLGFSKDIAVSSGSACTSATLEPSYVLKALGVDDDLAKSAIRFGLSRFTTEEEIDYTIQQVSERVLKLRDTNLPGTMKKANTDFEKI